MRVADPGPAVQLPALQSDSIVQRLGSVYLGFQETFRSLGFLSLLLLLLPAMVVVVVVVEKRELQYFGWKA
jgi:hypothetical protein